MERDLPVSRFVLERSLAAGARHRGSRRQYRATAAGSEVVVDMALISLAVLDLGLSNYAEALDAARRVADARAPSWTSHALPLLVEASVRSGDRDTAHAALARFAKRARGSGTAWALGLLASSEALLDDGDADRLYRNSLEHLTSTSVVTERARTHLLYGEWLRRHKRQSDARKQLTLAHNLFSEVAAKAYAERARMELAATGAHPGVDP